MRATEIQGEHPEWQDYLNGPPDYAGLCRVHGIGPARAALLLRVYGSIDRFVDADPRDVAARTQGLIGPGLARTLRQRCIAAGIRSDWSRLEALARGEEPADVWWDQEREDGGEWEGTVEAEVGAEVAGAGAAESEQGAGETKRGAGETEAGVGEARCGPGEAGQAGGAGEAGDARDVGEGPERGRWRGRLPALRRGWSALVGLRRIVARRR